jgi:hypothetical protein
LVILIKAPPNKLAGSGNIYTEATELAIADNYGRSSLSSVSCSFYLIIRLITGSMNRWICKCDHSHRTQNHYLSNYGTASNYSWRSDALLQVRPVALPSPRMRSKIQYRKFKLSLAFHRIPIFLFIRIVIELARAFGFLSILWIFVDRGENTRDIIGRSIGLRFRERLSETCSSLIP